MTFLAILFALLIEQFKPLRANNWIYARIRAWSLRLEIRFNAGQAQHGRLAWMVMVALLVAPVALVCWACMINPLATLIWSVLIAYLTLGFRHYSHYFTSIQVALTTGDEATARTLLAAWTGTDTADLNATEISRIAIEKALIAAHRNVFGVFFWFLMPLGPAWAVLYRLAEHLARVWNEPAHMRNEVFGQYAARAFYLIDWIPARLTAIAFAVVGNFEEAIYAWRNFAQRWENQAVGILLAAGGGALGVRLGAFADNGLTGEEPNLRALQSTVGLLWRALLLWMLLLLLLSMAAWLG